MNRFELTRYESMIRVSEFGTRHSADFPAGTLGEELFQNLSRIVEHLHEHAAEKNSRQGDRRLTATRKSAAKEKLYEEMQVVSRTARILGLEDRGIERKFLLPYGIGARPLVGLARGFAKDAEPLAELFIRHALPSDFIARLNRLADELETAIGARGEATETAVENNATIDSLIEDGMTTLKKLDVIVRNTYRDQPLPLDAWERAKHRPRTMAAAASVSPAAPLPTA
jgi:hypothetical protein